MTRDPGYRRLVAFTGRKGSGKDTAARILVTHDEWTRINFGDVIKRVCGEIYGLTYGQMNDPTLKETELVSWPFNTPREIMQEVGQLWRDAHPEIWVWCWKNTVRRAFMEDPDLKVVVTDLRYATEEKIIKCREAVVIRIKRPDLEDDEFSPHESESYIDKIQVDFTIVNNGTIAELDSKVEECLRRCELI